MKELGLKIVKQTFFIINFLANLIFKIVELPNKDFIRKGNNLVAIVNITLASALCSDSLNLRMLDGRKIFVAMD